MWEAFPDSVEVDNISPNLRNMFLFNRHQNKTETENLLCLVKLYILGYFFEGEFSVCGELYVCPFNLILYFIISYSMKISDLPKYVMI